MFVLDSSAFIELLENSMRQRAVLNAVGAEPPVLTSISLHEVLACLSDAERALVEEKVDEMRVLEHTDDAARIGASLERDLHRRGQMVGKADLFIASVCIAHRATLVTFDTAFERIKGLQVQTLRSK